MPEIYAERINAVKLDERLTPLAREVYEGPVTLQYREFTNDNEQQAILECFGDKIRELNSTYEEDYHCFNGKIEKLINDKCCRTLDEINLTNVGRFAMSAIDKPFEKVSTVRIRGHKFCNFIENFDKWFPAADTLDMLI